MKVSLKWLGRYVDLDDQTPEQVRNDLTLSTAEIEEIEEFGAGLEDLVVGHVIESGRHPNADKLSLNSVDVGDGEPLSIVCGAPNVAAGQKVVVIRPGSTLPDGTKIKKSKIRGTESFGMICSESELGLSEDHDGIIVLSDKAVVGKRFVDTVPVRDHVLEIDNKSVNHRPDLWGHYGMARELAAIHGRPLRPLEIVESLPADGRKLDIAIENAEDCARFTGIVLQGVRPVPSPEWMRYLLAAVGQRSIDLLVDLTNFVMFELGQPMHAFDLGFLDPGGILVRRATDKERMTTLDGVERVLSTEDLVVTSGGRPVALAGVMGGEGSMVREGTSDLFLESANFHPTLIRRTSNRLGLRSEASARFEKSLDPATAEQGSRRFMHLLGELCPGARPAGPLVDPAQWKFEPRSIALRKARLDLKLGVELPPDKVEGILSSLQFEVKAQGGDWSVGVPSFRATKDITIEDDLIEEVGRMFRYDNIPEEPLRSVVAVPKREAPLYLAREILRIGATELGCHEVYNYSFVADAVVEAVEAAGQPYSVVANPVAPEQSRIRRHVAPSVLAVVGPNLRARSEVRLMESGKGYHPEQVDEHGLPREVFEVAFVWSRLEGEHPYPELRSHMVSVLDRIGHRAELDDVYRRDGISWMHPTKTTTISRGGPAVGYVGCLHPAVARNLGLPATTAVANLDVRALLATGRERRGYKSIPRFPAQPVDVALLVPTETRTADVARFLAETGKKLVRSVELFEVYRGKGLPEGKKSLNFTVTLGAADRTLDSADEEKYLSKVRARAGEVGAELRG